MADPTKIEERLALLERDVSELKQQLKAGAAAGSWIDRITGSMEAFPEFEEVVRLGREIRRAEQAPDHGTH
jgi:hypothetical protein